MKIRFDVCYHSDYATIEPHFCREWDENGGCYGTNPDHGLSFDEACDEVAAWYEREAQFWRSCKRADLSDEDMVRGALIKYQMALDASALSGRSENGLVL